MTTVHKPRPYQQKLIDEILHAWFVLMARVVLAVLPTGGGKCLGRDTPVLMYNGTVKMVQDVVVGDRLMGPDSKPRLVVSLARGVEDMWRVVPRKGDPFIVNGSHILSLKITNGAKGICAPDGTPLYGGEIVNCTIDEYLRSSKSFKHVAKTWRTGVDFEERRTLLPLPPYILGAWLGDGTSCRAEVTTGDSELYHEFNAYATSVGMKVNIRPNSTGSFLMQMHGDGKRYGCGGSPMGNALRDLNVMNNKHVPLLYRTASRQDRLELLAGIIDTDGSYDGKQFELTLKSKGLMDGVVYVARSLGFACTPRAVTKTCGNNGRSGVYWRCSIGGPLDEIPTRLERKRAAPRQQIKDVLMTGFRIEPVGVDNYFGFELFGPDRLFLLGDFTVTHNTFIFANIIAQTQGAVCAIVHRGELVTQISLALAREGVRHRIIGQASVARACSAAHMEELGRDYVSPTSRVAVASVDTLIRMDPNDPWFSQVVLWVGDEGHHFLVKNKWGKAVVMFTNARGLLVTATPARADGAGLGRKADGFADVMVVGPGPRDLINLTYLCDYRIINKPSDIDLSAVTTSESGDYSPPKLSAARAESHITGDVVEHYLQYAAGKRGITFDVDVKSATETAAAFRARGVPAEVVSGKTPDDLRRSIIRRFRAGEILQLVNVDLFGEGFDLPAIEVVSMARPTQSYGLYIQSFGRALRPMEGKKCLVEGTLVLTQRGPIAIEKVLLTDTLWDGVEWVSHDGATYMGEKDVIAYQGLEATPDHLVHTAQGWKTFGECAEQQIPITTTGSGRHAIRVSGDHQGGSGLERQAVPADVRVGEVSDVSARERRPVHESDGRPHQRVPQLQSAQAVSDMALCARPTAGSPLHRSVARVVAFLRWTRDSLQLQIGNRSLFVDPGQPRHPGTQSHDADRPNRQRWPLRTGQLTLVNAESKHGAYDGAPAYSESAPVPNVVPRREIRRFDTSTSCSVFNVRSDRRSVLQPPVVQTQRRVWDVLNAGPRRRFTAQGLLVHNSAIIIDHVGNVARHGLPDAPREWSLDRREKRARSGTSDAIPTRTCMNPDFPTGSGVPCASVYERFRKVCPFCGFPVTITNRSGPEHVDGVLAELDPAVLAAMRGETAAVMQGAKMPVGVTPEVRIAIMNRHHAAQTAQFELRRTMALWSGWQQHLGRTVDEQQARFYYRYGVDVESAQAYKKNDALTLRERILEELNRHNVVEAS